MTRPFLASWAMLGSGGAVFGMLFGLVYFAALRQTVALHAARRHLTPSALTVVRLTGGIVFFGLLARLGALPLLSAFGGFLLVRTLALRTARRLA